MQGAVKTQRHFHDLRHEVIERGLSLPEVALISGHRDHRMLLRYTHLRPENLVAKLDVAHEAQTGRSNHLPSRSRHHLIGRLPSRSCSIVCNTNTWEGCFGAGLHRLTHREKKE